MSLQANIATNRFGLGARPNELAKAKHNPKAWLIKQLQLTPAVSFNNNLPHSSDIAKKLNEYRLFKKKNKQNAMAGKAFEKNLDGERYKRQVFQQLTADTLLHAIKSDHSLNWRLLDFFSNHFSVSTSGSVMRALAPTLEREAIAPNLLGRFEDMLIAVEQHPAMLIYLNNEKSFGPNSKMKNKSKGLNENLAREILELHALGVNGGYSQVDVIELAKAITGWSVANPVKDKQSGFKFRAYGHEPGIRSLFGKKYKK